MTRKVLWGVGVVAAIAAFVGWHAMRLSTDERLFDNPIKPPEAEALCPWRQPESDLKELFPTATRYEVETRILSGLRTELGRRLGRTPTGEENALRLYRVYGENGFMGTVLTRRVKGEYGAIELVLALDANQRIAGLHVQRLREPETVAKTLENPAWLRSFQDRTAEGPWDIDEDVGKLPSEAQVSARAVAEGIRSLLILLAVAENSGPQSLVAGHHH